MSVTKILYLDIETAPNLSYTWGKWQQDVIKFKQEGYMLAVSWRWEHREGGEVTLFDAEAKGLCDFKRAKSKPFDDSGLVKLTLGLLDEADFVIGHNVERFDLRKIRTFAVKNGLHPPSPFQIIDTLKIAKREFYFQSNKLGDLCDYLGVPSKVQTGGFATWLGSMADEPEAWERMLKYAKQDSEILREVYLALRAWIPNHPVIERTAFHTCPVCGSPKLHKRGTKKTKVSTFQTWHCTECGSYSRERLADKSAAKPSLVGL